MTLQRHKNYKKDELKTKLTDEQYSKLIRYLSLLLRGEALPKESLDHSLQGEYKGLREFHLSGDMLIIYTIIEDTLYLMRMGTHSQLFK